MNARRWIPIGGLVGLLALSPSPSQAEEPVGATSLQVRWEADPPLYGVQTICGHVLNERPESAAHVRLRVEGLDERGGVAGRREADVLGQVPSRGNALFCISMLAGAATYRVTVVRADWMAEPSSP
jgi:hypothetical protein